MVSKILFDLHMRSQLIDSPSLYERLLPSKFNKNFSGTFISSSS